MKDKAQEIAKKVANRLQSEAGGELSVILQSIEKLHERLNLIENTLNQQQTIVNQPSIVSFQPLKTHPSQEKFQLAEAIVDEIAGFLEKEKTCDFEPHNKICDHCSMCSSRGF